MGILFYYQGSQRMGGVLSKHQVFWFGTGVDVVDVYGGSDGEGNRIMVQLEVAWVYIHD